MEASAAAQERENISGHTTLIEMPYLISSRQYSLNCISKFIFGFDFLNYHVCTVHSGAQQFNGCASTWRWQIQHLLLS